jgi:hypothetical protein
VTTDRDFAHALGWLNLEGEWVITAFPVGQTPTAITHWCELPATTPDFAKGDSHLRKDPPGQWILESYDVQKSYVLRKDGVHYQAHCRGMFNYVAPGGLDLSAGMVPIPPGATMEPLPTPTKPENFCSAILPYLHKPVPFRQSGDVLLFEETSDAAFKNWTTEFTITEAR